MSTKEKFSLKLLESLCEYNTKWSVEVHGCKGNGVLFLEDSRNAKAGDIIEAEQIGSLEDRTFKRFCLFNYHVTGNIRVRMVLGSNLATITYPKSLEGRGVIVVLNGNIPKKNAYQIAGVMSDNIIVAK